MLEQHNGLWNVFRASLKVPLGMVWLNGREKKKTMSSGLVIIIELIAINFKEKDHNIIVYMTGDFQ